MPRAEQPAIPDQVRLEGVPPYVHSWSAAKIPRFVPAMLRRWQRAGVDLSARFSLLLCPLAELNARGGLPGRVAEVTDPRLTCRHFTGCNRPYLAVLFGETQARTVRDEVLSLLAWSESYDVELTATEVVLHFAGATEEPEQTADGERSQRRVGELLASGELLRILE